MKRFIFILLTISFTAIMHSQEIQLPEYIIVKDSIMETIMQFLECREGFDESKIIEFFSEEEKEDEYMIGIFLLERKDFEHFADEYIGYLKYNDRVFYIKRESPLIKRTGENFISITKRKMANWYPKPGGIAEFYFLLKDKKLYSILDTFE